MAVKRKPGSSKAGRPRKDGPRFPGGQLKPGVAANGRVVAIRRELLGDAAADITRASSPMDLAYARGWLSERQHRTGALLEALYRRSGLPAPGIRPASSYEVDDALKTAAKIAAQSPVAAAMTKRAVNVAFETTLTEGVRAERALFLSLFGTPHQKEGMAAFAEKRKPAFN